MAANLHKNPGANSVKTLIPLNRWIDQATKGKIERMIDSIPPYTMMYLLNAIYFKGDWAHRFAEDKTRDEEFTNSLTKGALKG